MNRMIVNKELPAIPGMTFWIMNPFILLVFSMVLLFSCDKEKQINLPDHITAGQKSGPGIRFIDFEPYLDCYIANPYEKLDTNIRLDLNQDGNFDFLFQRNKSTPLMMGVSHDVLTLIPLESNEVCVVPNDHPIPAGPCMPSALDWTDALFASDTIDLKPFWTNEESLVYEHTWVLSPFCTLTEGLWNDINTPGERCAGIKIVKDETDYFGWIGLYREANTNVLRITGYGIMHN